MKIINRAINFIAKTIKREPNTSITLPSLKKTVALIPIFQANQNSMFSIMNQLNAGWHGTTKEQLGEQLTKREFENRGQRIYFDDLTTAATYAHYKAINGETPIVVKIRSIAPAKTNDPMGKQGFYSFYQRDVKIIEAYTLKPSNIDN